VTGPRAARPGWFADIGVAGAGLTRGVIVVVPVLLGSGSAFRHPGPASAVEPALARLGPSKPPGGSG